MKKILTGISMIFIMIVSVGISSCQGSSVLHEKISKGIEGIESKWTRQFVWMGAYFAYIPAWFIDTGILNLVEFWTGNNPMAATEFDENGTAIKEISKDGYTLRMTYLKNGSEMQLVSFKDNMPIGQTIVIYKSQPGVVYQLEKNGELTEVQPNTYMEANTSYAKLNSIFTLSGLVH